MTSNSLNLASSVTNELLDRLVDDSLSETQRRELLQALAVAPDGWRRCALAFLEAQEWRHALREVAAPPARLAIAVPETTPPARLHWRPILTLVVSLLIAFAGGASWDQWQQARLTLAQRRPNATTEPTNVAPVETVGYLRLPSMPGQASREVTVPVVAGPGVNEAWLTQQPPPIAESVRQQLERQGLAIHQARTFVPLSLDDGRQVVVPVDRVEIRPMARSSPVL